MKKLATITPFLYEGYLVIALHSDWIKLFKKIPTFVVHLDDKGFVHIVSCEAIENVF